MDTLRSPRNRWAPLSKAVRCGEKRFSQLETIDKKTQMEGEGASGSTSAKSRLHKKTAHLIWMLIQMIGSS